MHLWQPIPVSQEWNIRRCQCMVSVATILQIFTMELASGEQMKSIATARNSLSLHNGHLYCLVGRSSFPFSIYCQLCDQAVFWNLEVFDCSQSSFNNNQTADRTAGKDDRPSFLHNQTNEETHFLFLIVDHTKRKKKSVKTEALCRCLDQFLWITVFFEDHLCLLVSDFRLS